MPDWHDVRSLVRPKEDVRWESPSPQQGEGWGEGKWHVLVVIALILLALWLRWGLNGTWRLGPDEALYSTWARRIAEGVDPWLAHTSDVDKPPLLMYSIAASMRIYGFYEFASRFPNIVASTLTIYLTYALAARLYGRGRTALLALLLATLSPFAILYAPTAFADPLMVMWLKLSLVLAVHERWTFAGVAAAAAVLTKQEAPLFLPLILMVGLALGWKAGSRPTEVAAQMLRYIGSCVAVAVACEGLWEAARPMQPSPFALGLEHYGGIGLVAPHEIVPRMSAWWDEALRWVFVSPILNGLLLLSPLVLGIRLARRRSEYARADGLVLASVLYVVAARWVVGFQVWNRYMLLAVPFLCIMVGRAVDELCTVLQRRLSVRLGGPAWSTWLPVLLVAVLLVAPVTQARAGQIPVGSDHGRYWGIDETARFVRENVPPGSVLFHHTLGWQLGYYLYGARLDFWWYPTVDWLAETAASRAQHSQYIILPSWEDGDAVAYALAVRGLELRPVHYARRSDGSVSFVTYRIALPRQ